MPSEVNKLLLDLACVAFANHLLAALEERENDFKDITGVCPLDLAFLIPDEVMRLV